MRAPIAFTKTLCFSVLRYTCTCTFMCMRTSHTHKTYIDTYAYTHTYTTYSIYICTHTHTHIHTQNRHQYALALQEISQLQQQLRESAQRSQFSSFRSETPHQPKQLSPHGTPSVKQSRSLLEDLYVVSYVWLSVCITFAFGRLVCGMIRVVICVYCARWFSVCACMVKYTEVHAYTYIYIHAHTSTGQHQ